MKKIIIPLFVGSIAIYTLTPSLAQDWRDNEMGSELKSFEKLKVVEKIIALFKSPTAIDLDTGCGHRNYLEIGPSNGIFYPDGIERSWPYGEFRRVTRHWNDWQLEITHQYWNDWLGFSKDIE